VTVRESGRQVRTCRGRSANPNVVDRRDRDGDRGVARLSGDFRRVDDMSEQQMRDIVAFLGALTDESFDRTVPRDRPERASARRRIRR
jgi:hypothetical protein